MFTVTAECTCSAVSGLCVGGLVIDQGGSALGNYRRSSEKQLQLPLQHGLLT